VGKTTFAGNLEAVALRGHVVIFGAASGPADPFAPNMLQKRSITVSGGILFNYLLDRKELEIRARDVLDGIKSGWLKLRVEHVLPLDKAVGAHKMLEGRQSVGKIVLKAD
jgi:NADPH2:quinone reductase